MLGEEPGDHHVEAVGKERKPVAGASHERQNDLSLLADSGSLGVALSCASPKRSRLLPEVFDGCRMLEASSLL